MPERSKGDVISSTFKSYHRFQSISPGFNEKFASTSPITYKNTDFMKTNKGLTPNSNSGSNRLDTFFDAVNYNNSRNAAVGVTGGTVPVDEKTSSSNPFKGTLLKSNTMSGTMFKSYQA
jgi:hypothetical protein